MKYQYNDIISKLVAMLNGKLLFTRSHIAGARGPGNWLATSLKKSYKKTIPYIEGSELVGLAATGDCGCQ